MGIYTQIENYQTNTHTHITYHEDLWTFGNSASICSFRGQMEKQKRLEEAEWKERSTQNGQTQHDVESKD